MRLNPVPIAIFLILMIVGYAVYNFVANNPFGG
jgi:hypothetical protein